MSLDFKISSIISEQLPEFVQSNYPNFISFLENYYEYIERVGEPTEIIQNLSKYNDIDLTQDAWITYFLKYYAEDIPKNKRLDDKVLVKTLTELYNRKGSEKAVKMLFRVLYGASTEVQYPFEFVLRSSGGQWRSPVSLKIRSGLGDFTKLIGTTITGDISGATGYVVDIIKYVLNGEMIHELFLDRKSLTGTFQSFETITGSYSSLKSSVLIENIYLDIFDREPTETEISAVLEDFNNGVTLTTVIKQLLKSSAVLQLPNISFINKIYYAATGSLPTDDQRFYEHTRIQDGVSKSLIVDDVIASIQSVRFLKNYSLDRNSVTASGTIIPVVSDVLIRDGGRNYSVGDKVSITTNLGTAYGVVADVDLNQVWDYSDYELLSETSDVFVTETGNIIGQEIDKTTVSLPSEIEVLLEDGNVLLHQGNTSVILETLLYKPSNSIVKIEMTDCFTLVDPYEQLNDFEILLENYNKILNEDTSVSDSSIILETKFATMVRDFEFLNEDSSGVIKVEDGYSSMIQEKAYSAYITFVNKDGGATDGIRSDVDIVSGPVCRYYGDWKNQQSRISLNNNGSVTPGRNDIGADSIIRRRFLERVFYYSFNRVPTAIEYRDYENKIINGTDLPDVIAEVTSLPEAYGTGKPLNSNSQFITGLYRICLDREPEAGGLVYWVKLLARTNLESFIINTYLILFGRTPTVTEESLWKQFINSNESNKLYLMKDFIKTLANNEEAGRYLADFNNFLNSLYRAAYSRNPTETERNRDFQSIQKGEDRLFIINLVLDSIECSNFLNSNYLFRAPRELIAKTIAESPEAQTYLEQFLVDQVLIKDPVYYSPFSYTILSEEPKIKWEKPVKDLVHPAGLQSFGRVKVFVKNSV